MHQLHESRTQSWGVLEARCDRQRRDETRAVRDQQPHPPGKTCGQEDDAPGTPHLAPAVEAPPHPRMAGAIKRTVEGDVPKEEDTLFVLLSTLS